MADQPSPDAAVDSGLGAVLMLLRYHGIGADPGQIHHRFGGVRFGVPEILRSAKEFGLRARAFSADWAWLANTPLPGVAALKDGDFLIAGRVGDGKILVQSPGTAKPRLMSQGEFQAVWDGRIVLMTRRAALGDLDRRFN